MTLAQKPCRFHGARLAIRRARFGRWPARGKTFAPSLPRLAVLVLAWYALVFNTMLVAAAFAAPSPAHWELCLQEPASGNLDGVPAPMQVPACVKHCLSGATSGGAPVLAQIEPAIFTSKTTTFAHAPSALSDASWHGVFARGPPESV